MVSPALIWIVFILLYFIFNLNVVVAFLATEADDTDVQVRAMWVIFGIFFGLPALIIVCVAILIIMIYKAIDEGFQYHRTKKLRRRRMVTR